VASIVCLQSSAALAQTIFLPLIHGQQDPTGEEMSVRSASAALSVIVQLVPGADPYQVAADHQATVVGSIPALSFYRLQGSTPLLQTQLTSDARVVFTQLDNLEVGFEARQQRFNAMGSDFEYLQRFFGFGSGDPENETFDIDPTAKKPKKGKVKKDQPKSVEQVLVVDGQRLDKDWET
jgi:hypothetical protein